MFLPPTALLKPNMKEWIKIALEKEILITALRVAAVVGTILVAINYGDRIFYGSLNYADFLKIAITYTVPYFVSTYSCVKLRLREKR